MERGREKEYLYARPTEEEDEEEEEEEWEYPDETQVYLRSKFYESWLWTDVDLPSQADRDGWVRDHSLVSVDWERVASRRVNKCSSNDDAEI